MGAQARILLVEDDPAQRRLLAELLQCLGYRVVEAGSASQATALVCSEPVDLILLDVRLPDQSGLELLGFLRQQRPQTPVVVITAYADVRQAVSAIKQGATDYLAKPLDLDELAAVVADALADRTPPEELAQPDRLGQLHPPAEAPLDQLKRLVPGLVCESLAMRRLLQSLAVVAPTDVPVLITGPTGSGKELIAQLIHRASLRSAGPMIAANCAGLPETLLESELFGHTKGAFTGADRERPGLFRSAHGGTLFLDEIGELPLHLQPKLLRALETGQITPVGSDRPVQVDIRLVAATNRNLTEEVQAGRFREDLYYRLNVIELAVPPLAERPEDILPLARQFAQEVTGATVRFSPQATECLLAYCWPGNVRQLRNAIHRACLMCRGDVILPEHLPPQIARLAQASEPRSPTVGRLTQLERAAILAALQECGGNRTQAAKKLGISRRTLLYKLRALQEEQPS
ncbi:MAG: sigma-54 dependent transcriptional regulator [Thermoguttaceae bacterium]|nr:sigma-54 dependent transcriptional regulator [Thermoguttaceae bacterium]MDW8037683.1 sigma-54 dependent transcriptional regulator [Thermoguttaceae bacterium]